MSDIPDTNDINKLAAWFDKDTLELIGHILNKHTKACLFQMKELVIERKELKKRLAAAEAKNVELEQELFIFAFDVIYFENDKMPDWIVDKARTIYYRPLRETGGKEE